MRADLARVVAVIAVAWIAPGSATRAEEAPAEEVARVGAVRMQARALAPREGDRELQFTRVDGSTIGLDRPNDYSIRDLYTPFWNGRGLAAGDIDRDGWPDLAVAGDRGVWIFMNRGGERFERRALDIPELASREIFAVALVDLDDDGWLDIFTTSWGEGNAWVRSDSGEFRREGLRAAPAGRQNLTQALSFGDLDRDGDLDAVAGNWYAGWETRFPPDRAANAIYRNDGGQLAQEVMTEIPGETLSLLLSDFTGDDHLDLIVGNDFGVSDQYYAGDGRGGLVPFARSDGRIPVTTFSTMSIDTADLDNDLDLDVYLTQIAARATGAAADISAGGRPWSRYCEDLEPGPGRDRCVRNIDEGRLLFRFLSRFRPSLAQSCRKIADHERRVECLALMTLLSADREKAPALCQRIPETEARLRQQCRDHFVRIPRPDPEAMSRSIPQRMNENVLLIAAGGDRFEDQASARGVGFTGWSWTGRFHDLDTDGWQDLYVVAGTMARDVRAGTAGNSFFRSVRGETFD